MATVKLTKTELKKQKDALKRYQRYLPTLMLKKQQLQLVIRQVEQSQRDVRDRKDQFLRGFSEWVAVFGDDVDLKAYVHVDRLDVDTGNIAGIDIPVFNALTFLDAQPDLFATPLWVDAGIKALQDVLQFDAELAVLERQRELLSHELRITTQRVNLFEKVKIPETKEHIRRIRISLGDQQTAAVVRGKMAKAKVTRSKVS